VEWFVLFLGGGGAVAAGRYLVARRRAGSRSAEELESVRRTADEDVTKFGEELTHLDEALAGRELDAAIRRDFQAALDAYELGKRAVARLRSAQAISTVVDALAEGRYAAACVRARAAGKPVPERRVSCFFNPQHGPSVVDVVWTPWSGGTRKVPACAQDAARLKAGDEPEVYYVKYGDRRVPYWEAGDPNGPYTLGFSSSTGARAINLHLELQMRGIDVGRGRKDPHLLPAPARRLSLGRPFRFPAR
jgi:hypothetical protein